MMQYHFYQLLKAEEELKKLQGGPSQGQTQTVREYNHTTGGIE